MSLTHILEDGTYNDVSAELRNIKSLARALASAADDGGIDEKDFSNLGFLIYDHALNAEKLLSSVEECRETPTPECATAPSGERDIDPILENNLIGDLRALAGVREVLLKQAEIIKDHVAGAFFDLDRELPPSVKDPEN